MATIKNTTTNEITELTMLSVAGIELMTDILGNYGVSFETVEGQRVYKLDSTGIAWWSRWIEREERIAEAYDDCDDESTIAAYWQAINENQDNLERMQDELERVLGIGDDSEPNNWKRSDYGDLVRDDGSWLEYGAFGRDTYGLHYVGKPGVVYKVYGVLSEDVPAGYSTTEDAERIIRNIEEGRA